MKQSTFHNYGPRANIVGLAYSIGIDLRKYVSDLETEIIHTATMWRTGSTGTHGQDSGYILQNLGQQIDLFIDQYFEVNESACKQRNYNSTGYDYIDDSIILINTMEKIESTLNPDKAKESSKPRGRPRKNDIMNLQKSIPATPEELAKVILSTPPRKVKV